MINRILNKYHFLLRWYKLVKDDAIGESVFWNIIRELNSNNWNKKNINKFLQELDEHIRKIDYKDLSKIKPYKLFDVFCKNKYCIVGKDIRIDADINQTCSGINKCKRKSFKRSPPYTENRLCRAIELETYAWEYGLSGSDSFNDIDEIYNEIKSGTYSTELATLREKPIWLTTVEDVKLIKKKYGAEVATGIRESLGLVHFYGNKIILIEFPAKLYAPPKISKPTLNLAPSIPFRVNITDEKCGRTINTRTGKESSREYISCPNDISLFFSFKAIGKPFVSSIDYNVHIDKMRIDYD